MLQYIEYRLIEEGIINGGIVDLQRLKVVQVDREVQHV